MAGYLHAFEALRSAALTPAGVKAGAFDIWPGPRHDTRKAPASHVLARAFLFICLPRER
jgi:hypothetical protein